MIIHVKSLKDRKTFDVEVQPNFTADLVKDAIAKQIDAPPNGMRLVFGGKPLRDGPSLSELGVQKGATVHLVLRLKTYITLTARVMSGKTIAFDADPRSEVSEITNNLHELLELDERPRLLAVNGRPLNPKVSLGEGGNGVKADCVAHLILVPLPNLPSLYLKEDDDRLRVFGKAGSLYARCGGIFGIAAFVDRCMDAWMADPILNANNAVATWHQRAQRCGFKFLVT